MHFPYDRACPQCGAPAGRGCVGPHWQPLQQPHQARSAGRSNGPRDQQYPNLEVNEAKWVRKQLALPEHEPEEEILDLAEEFLRKKDYLKGQIGRTPDINQFKTSPELRAFLIQYATSLRIIDPVKAAAEATVVYDSPNWLVVMPETLQSSIHYGKNTTWCTARTDGSNLFYNYVARRHDDIMLYYMLNKHVSEGPLQKLSLGVINGTPAYQGHGGVSVDADNGGVDEARFRQILGPEFGPVFSAVTRHAAVVQGQHPAKRDLQVMLQNPARFKKYFKALDKDARQELAVLACSYKPGPEIMSILASDSSPEVRIGIARRCELPAAVVSVLAADKEQDVRSTVVGNQFLPPELLAVMSGDASPKVRASVAAARQLPQDIRHRLMADPDDTVRASVVRNTDDEVLLTRLSQDPSPDVRIAVAQRRQTPEYIRESLAADRDVGVQRSVAETTSSPAVLSRLASASDESVKRAVAGNKHTPILVLYKLSGIGGRVAVAAMANETRHTREASWSPNEAEWQEILESKRLSRDVAAATPSLQVWDRLARHPDADVRSGAAANFMCRHADKRMLARDSDPSVRLLLARQFASTPAVAVVLARDADPDIRLALASQKGVAPEAMAILAEDGDLVVRGRLLSHIQTTDLAAAISKHGGLHQLSASDRHTLAGNPAAPRALYTALARDPDPDVRLAVASNKRTHPMVLERLRNDPDPAVWQAARYTLINLQRAAAEDQERKAAQPTRTREERLAQIQQYRAEAERQAQIHRARMRPEERAALEADERRRRAEAPELRRREHARKLEEAQAVHQVTQAAERYRQALAAGTVTPRPNGLAGRHFYEGTTPPKPAQVGLSAAKAACDAAEYACEQARAGVYALSQAVSLRPADAAVRAAVVAQWATRAATAADAVLAAVLWSTDRRGRAVDQGDELCNMAAEQARLADEHAVEAQQYVRT